MIKNKSKESDLNADIDIVCKPQPKENHHSKRVTKIREYTSRKDRTSEQIMMKIPNTNMNLKTELPQNKNNGVRERNNYNWFSEKSKFNSHRNSIYWNDNKVIYFISVS